MVVGVGGLEFDSFQCNTRQTCLFAMDQEL